MSNHTRNQRRRVFRRQKLMGVALLVVTFLFVLLCSTANEDCGAALVTGPLGLLLLFSKEIWIV